MSNLIFEKSYFQKNALFIQSVILTLKSRRPILELSKCSGKQILSDFLRDKIVVIGKITICVEFSGAMLVL